jgi:hypothetical protein
MAATAGAVACTGVATAALIIRRDATEPPVAGQAESNETERTDVPIGTYVALATSTMPGYFFGDATTTTMPPTRAVDPSLVWNALSNLQFDPSAAGLAYPVDGVDVNQMPTAEMFGCVTTECGAMFNYIVWHEIARALGFYDVQQMQSMNSGIDFALLPQKGDVLQSVYGNFEGPPQTTIYVTAPATSTTTTTSLVVEDPSIVTTTTAVGQIGTTTTP